MTDHLTEDQVIAAIPGLTRLRLIAFIETRLVVPAPQQQALLFRQVDCARLRLLCDLADDLDLHVDALGVIISLIDQLHATRQDLLDVARAVDAQEPEVRTRIGAAILGARG